MREIGGISWDFRLIFAAKKAVFGLKIGCKNSLKKYYKKHKKFLAKAIALVVE